MQMNLVFLKAVLVGGQENVQQAAGTASIALDSVGVWIDMVSTDCLIKFVCPKYQS